MQQPNRKVLETFDESSLPDLDTVVLAALELLEERGVPSFSIDSFKKPLVVGSGNAEATGRIIFQQADAVFASESNFEQKLQNIPDIDEVILVSASGGKHAPIIAKTAKKYQKHVTLLTNTADSPAAQATGSSDITELVFPKNREPYTYNTSTYMGMMLGYSKEDPTHIREFINNAVTSLDMPDFSKYDKYYLIVPAEFSGIIRMLQVKFIELFGRNIARDVETIEYVRHATTVAPADELFISFGSENQTWGTPENRLNVPLPEPSGYVAMMAIGYFVVGQIQKQQPQYFKDNIVEYTKQISEVFGETISPIVPGN
ncbi:MAG: hypothetical protein WD061_03670 [Candidatus Saccharimonadales bacterium]